MTQSLGWGGSLGGEGRGGGGRGGSSSCQLSAPRFAAKTEAAAPRGPGQSLALEEAEVVGPLDVQSPALNLGLGPARQHLRDLSLLICQKSQESILEGSCEAWQ